LSGTKIKKLADLKKICDRLRRKGKKIVFTNGCFDIIHYGHVMYLEKAKAIGECLIVALNSDRSVRKIKGENRPINNETDRSKVLAGLESVDYVVIFSENDPLTVIKALRPDILVKGSDWKSKVIVGADFVKSQGGKVATIPLARGRSTSNLIKKIAKTR
jgi:D-beta-D-heptose 7-phosphate kinase/D-beta-D-heptose 1-phosphate adenosyltransferase